MNVFATRLFPLLPRPETLAIRPENRMFATVLGPKTALKYLAAVGHLIRVEGPRSPAARWARTTLSGECLVDWLCEEISPICEVVEEGPLTPRKRERFRLIDDAAECAAVTGADMRVLRMSIDVVREFEVEQWGRKVVCAC